MPLAPRSAAGLEDFDQAVRGAFVVLGQAVKRSAGAMRGTGRAPRPDSPLWPRAAESKLAPNPQSPRAPMESTSYPTPRTPIPASPRRPRRLPRGAAFALSAILLALLAACGSMHGSGGSRIPVGNSQRDGPEANPPPNLDQVPDAVPQIEPIRIGGPNKPYEIDGRTYTPITDDRSVVDKGLASWYGKKFHGRRTASGEAYNMYAMTAAHKTLPIPSYARVRNPANGREVLVRVNDRGPFAAGRVIDLSYTAALKLGVLNGVQPVEIERITDEDIRTGAAFRRNPTYAQAPAPAAAAPQAVAVGDVDRGSITAQAARGNPGASTSRTPRPVRTQVLPPMPGDIVVASADAPAHGAPVGTIDLGAAAAAASPAPSAPPAPPEEAAASAPLPPPAGIVLPPPAASAAAPVVVAAVPAPAGASAPAVREERGRAETTAGAGFWVQLGAYRERNGALDFQHRLIDSQPWLAPLLAVFTDRGLNKLQAGPYPSREEARSVAERIRVALQLVPTIVEKR